MTILLANGQVLAEGQNTSTRVLRVDPSNPASPLEALLEGAAAQQCERIELAFPKFTDGRAYSWAARLRHEGGFTGDLRAVGDVLVDQLSLMWRTGFSSFELRADQSIELARKRLAVAQHAGRRFYQPGAVAGDIFRARSLA